MAFRLSNYTEIDEKASETLQTEMRQKILQNLSKSTVRRQVASIAKKINKNIEEVKKLTVNNAMSSHWRNLAKTLQHNKKTSFGDIEDNLKNYKRLMGETYQLTQELLGVLRGEKVTYAIYYENKRIQIDDIPIENFTVTSNGNLMFNFTQKEFTNLYEQQGRNLELEEHFDRFYKFIEETYWYESKSPILNRYINRGTIAEAFEDEISSKNHNVNHSFNRQDVWGFVHNAARDTTAWYVQGDVGMVQVKNITSGALRVASLSSLEYFANIVKDFMNGKDSYEEIVDKLIENMLITHKRQNTAAKVGKNYEQTCNDVLAANGIKI